MAAERPSTPGSDRAAPPRPPSRVEGAAVLGEDLSVAVSSVPEALLARQLLVHSPPPLALSQSTVLLAQAQCGFLFLHINTGLWKKISCQYSLGSLSCRSADDNADLGSFPVHFCLPELKVDGSRDDDAPLLPAAFLERKDSRSSLVASPPPPFSSPAPLPPPPASLTAAAAAAAPASNSGSPRARADSPAFFRARPESSPRVDSPLIEQPAALQRQESGASEASVATLEQLHAMLGSKEGRVALASYWTSLEGSFCFHIFSAGKALLLRAESEHIRSKFVDAIMADLRESTPPELLREKERAATELAPLMRLQYAHQLTKYNELVSSLSRAGLVEDLLPVTSKRKEKSGVLSMLEPETGQWKDFYFVLFERVLYFYKDSKSTTPTGFVTLRLAAVLLDSKRLAKNEVALSEWVSVLGGAISQATAETRRSLLPRSRSSGSNAEAPASLRVLESIKSIITDITSFEAFLGHEPAVEEFRAFVAMQGRRDLCADVALWQQIDRMRSAPAAADDTLRRAAEDIFERFLGSDARERVMHVPDAMRRRVLETLGRPSPKMYDDVASHVRAGLEPMIALFRTTPQYAQLVERLERQTKEEVRSVELFEGRPSLFFTVKERAVKQSREVKFDKRKTVLTIGRDKSNSIVIDDSRVSRSHARVEYSDTYCEFIDLGSSCGSKLNGRPVLRSRLRHGDILEVGHSVLIFHLKRAGWLSLFWT